MKLEEDGNGGWRAITSYGEPGRERAKTAGFRWQPDRKIWTTSDPDVASTLLGMLTEADEIADGLAEAISSAAISAAAAATALIAASHAADADIHIPAPPGLAYMPFQLAGISYLRDRFAAGARGVLLADEMGLGKTIQVIGAMNAALAEPGRDRLRALVIAPKIALRNWHDEIQKWLLKPHTIAIWTSGQQPDADIVIVNYDIVAKIVTKLRPAQPWNYLVCDEAHALKDSKAQRTKAVLGYGKEPPIPADHRIFVTGTPILNRPIELFPVLRACGVDFARDYYSYAKRYCDGYEHRYGYDATGSSNLSELQEKLRSSIMVRRMKADVLTELPDKIHQVVTIEDWVSDDLRQALRAETREQAAIKKAEVKAIADVAKARKGGNQASIDAAVNALSAIKTSNLAVISKLRRETALAKAPFVIDHVTEMLASVPGAVLVFAHHQDVVARLADGFRAAGFEPAIITGETSDAARQQAQEDIQQGRKRVFIGSITACGVAITLTAASNVAFAEQDWTPGRMAQAEDRAHRIGQKSSVLVQYLVVNGSIDATLLKNSHGKATTITAALDGALEDAPEAISVTPAETEMTPSETLEAGPITLVSQPQSEAEASSVAPIRNEEVRDIDIIDLVPDIPADKPQGLSVTCHENLCPVETTPASTSAIDGEPVPRKRGRPSLGDSAMSPAERARRYRAAHNATRSMRVSTATAQALSKVCAERGLTLDALVKLALSTLDARSPDHGQRAA